MSIFDDRVVGGRGSVRGDGVMGPPPFDGPDFVDTVIYARSSYDEIVRLDDAGQEIWKVSAPHGTGPYSPDAVAIHPEQGAVTVDGASPFGEDAFVHRISLGGEILWSSPLPLNDGRYIAVDKDGNAIVYNSDANLYKYDAGGSLLWSWTDGGSNPFGVSVDADGAIYAADNDGIRKISSKGDQKWFVSEDSTIGRLFGGTRVSDGVVYSSNDATLVYFDTSNGDEIGSVALSADIDAFDVANGHIFVATSGLYYQKLDISTWDVVWEIDLDIGSKFSRDIAVDPDGQVYSCTSFSSHRVQKISSDGRLMWSISDDSVVRSVAAHPGRYGAFPDHW